MKRSELQEIINLAEKVGIKTTKDLMLFLKNELSENDDIFDVLFNYVSEVLKDVRR